jgi:hypothetical protein
MTREKTFAVTLKSNSLSHAFSKICTFILCARSKGNNTFVATNECASNSFVHKGFTQGYRFPINYFDNF